MNDKITFKTITVNKENFLRLVNPDQQMVETDGHIGYHAGIYGTKNDDGFCDLLIDLYTNGAGVHQNIVNLKAQQILGNNLQAEDDADSAVVDPFIAHRNKAGHNLKQIYGYLAKDMAISNSAVLQIVFNRDGEVAEVYAIPFQDFRLGKPNKYGQIEFGYLSKNWANISNSKVSKGVKEKVKIRMFDPTNWKKYPVQLMYLKDYSYGYYAIPAYTSAINWILIMREISDFHLNNIRSNFFLSGMLVQKKGGMSDDQIEANAQAIEQFYKGGATGRKVLLSYVEDMVNDAPKFEKFSADDQDEMWSILSQQAFQSIVTAHNCYPILAGYDAKGADLGGDANKINIALQAFTSLVTEGMKEILISGLNRIMEINQLPPLACYTEPLKITLPDQQPGDTTSNERRSILFGLPPLDESANNANNSGEIPTA